MNSEVPNRNFNPERRAALLGTAATVAAGLAKPFLALAADSAKAADNERVQGARAVPRRIDTHSHVMPPAWAEWLRTQPRYRGPHMSFSKEAMLDAYEKNGIETAILSISTPGVWLGPGTDLSASKTLARKLNEFCAGLVRDNPQRFGFFATLILPDVDASIEEARYALDHLNADGVVLMANTDGMYLGAPEWDPLMKFLDERKTVLFIHPTSLPAPQLPGITYALVDFLADTTRAAVNLCMHDCMNRFPNVKIMLSHGGGYLPYAVMRIAAMMSVMKPASVTEESAIEQMRRFYFDTALTPGPYAMPSLLALADPQRLTFGSDLPYATAAQALKFTNRLDEYALTAEQRYAINRGNAERLFPRLAKAGG